MTEDTLREFAEAQLATAKKICSEGKEVMPVFIIDGDEPAIIGVPQYGDHRKKAALREQLKNYLIERDAERYAFVMEAWFGQPPAKPDPNYLPSKDPARQEGLFVIAVSCDGEHQTVACKIIRGETISFSDTIHMDYGLGPLGELFTPAGRPN